MPSWWFKAPHIDCHFCGHETDLSKGKHTARSFRCANCGSLNFLKADGSLDEETHQQIYSNAHLPANQESFARRAHSTTLSQQNAFTFCQACQRNQALQTYLLASYYGDEDLPPEEEARLEALLPSYKLELEDRYPSCCSECAPAAARLLRERDNKSRAVALNNTINRGSSPVKAHRVERDPRVLLTWKLEGILWRVKGLLWVLLQLASIAMYTLGVFHSDLALRLLQQYGMRLILAVCLASFLLSFWNPLWNRLRHERMRASEPHRIKLRNLGIWNSALLFAFVLRCFFCITLRLFLFASHIRAISLVSLIPTFIGIPLAYHCLSIQQPAPVRLVRNSRVTSSRPTTPSRPSTPSSLDHFTHPLFGQITPLNQPHNGGPPAAHDSNSMDLDDYHFEAPPKASKESTGLEHLLSSVLGLTDGPVFGNPAANAQQQPTFWSRIRKTGKRE